MREESWRGFERLESRSEGGTEEEERRAHESRVFNSPCHRTKAHT